MTREYFPPTIFQLEAGETRRDWTPAMQMLCAPNRTAPRVDHGNDGALILMRCVRGADEECFPSSPGGAAAFAESLGEASACGALSRACVHEPSTGCGHIGLGAAYYLRDTGLLDVLRRQDKHTWVIRQDFFDSDIVGLWDWLCVPAWEPRTVQTAASRRGATASLWPLEAGTLLVRAALQPPGRSRTK